MRGFGGTSIYCANYQRPLPFSDHTTANETTRIYTFNLNTASQKTEGWDFETNYGWQMSDLVDDWKGSWNTRLLATYQPVINNSVLYPGAPFTRIPDPSTRITWFLNYALNDWSLGLEDEWVSGFSQVAGPVLPAGSAQAASGLNNWVNPHVNSWNQVDLNISRNFQYEGADMTGYFVVQNFLNAMPAYIPNGTIGQTVSDLYQWLQRPERDGPLLHRRPQGKSVIFTRARPFRVHTVNGRRLSPGAPATFFLRALGRFGTSTRITLSAPPGPPGFRLVCLKVP